MSHSAEEQAFQARVPARAKTGVFPMYTRNKKEVVVTREPKERMTGRRVAQLVIAEEQTTPSLVT